MLGVGFGVGFGQLEMLPISQNDSFLWDFAVGLDLALKW